jgi:hypothetical protein
MVVVSKGTQQLLVSFSENENTDCIIEHKLNRTVKMSRRRHKHPIWLLIMNVFSFNNAAIAAAGWC